MGIINKAIPNIYKDELGRIQVEPVEDVFIDDAFDPLFNRKARMYLSEKYGNNLLGTLGGYAEMFENMIGGHNDQWGKLGPAMGVLGTFGRTLDKAEDFILGGVTEGFNALNKINPLANGEDPSNPIKNIFVEDQDYTGQRLLAAMGNSMSKLAGGASLNENDFKGGWSVPSIGIELMTDPGILGGAVASVKAPYTKGMRSKDILKNIGKNPDGSAVGEIARLLSNYDDLLAKASWDMTVPGLRPLLKNTMLKINQLVGGSIAEDFVDTSMPGKTTTTTIKKGISPEDLSDFNQPSPPRDFNVFKAENKSNIVTNPKRKEMLDNLAEFKKTNNIDLLENMINELEAAHSKNIYSDPELLEILNKTKENINNYKILTNGVELPSLEDLQQAKAKLDALKSRGLLTPELEEMRMDEINKMLEKYKLYNYDIFKDEISKIDTNVSNLKAKLNEDMVTRQSRYNPDVEGFTREITKSPNFNSGFKTTDNVKKILKEKESLDSFYEYLDKLDNNLLDSGLPPGHSLDMDKINALIDRDTEDVVINKFTRDILDGKVSKNESVNSFLKEELSKYIDNTGKLSEQKDALYDFYDHTLDLLTNVPEDDPLNEIFSYLDDLYYINQNPEPNYAKLVQAILNETVSDDDYINSFLKRELQKHIKGTKLELQTPVIASISTKGWQHDVFKHTQELVELRFRKAILQSPTLWHVDNVQDYMKELLKDPTFKAQFNKYIRPEYQANFKKNLEAVLSSTYLNKYGKQKQLTDATWLKDLEQFTTDILKLKNVDASPYIKPLVDAAEDVQTNIIPTLKVNDLSSFSRNADDIIDTQNPINKYINELLYKDPTYFLDESGNYIDYDKLVKASKDYPNLEFHIEGKTFKSNGVKGIKYKTDLGYIIIEDPKHIEQYSDYLHYLNPANKEYFKKVNVPKDINVNKYIQNVKKGTLNSLKNDIGKDTQRIILSLEPKEFAENVYSYKPIVGYSYDNIDDTFFAKYGISPDLPNESKIKTFKEVASESDKRFFDYLNEAKAVKVRNFEGDLATLRMNSVKTVLNKASALKKKYNEDTFKAVLTYMDAANDDIIKGRELLNEVASSRGFFITPFSLTKTDKINTMSKVLDNNIAKTTIEVDGKALPLFKKIDITKNNKRFLGLHLNTDINVIKNIKKYNLDELEDIVINKGNPEFLKKIEAYKDITDVFQESNGISSDLMRTFKLDTNLTDNYFKHAMIDQTKDSIAGATDIVRSRGSNLESLYKTLPMDDLDKMSKQLISDLNLRKQLGIVPSTRSLRGNILAWNQFDNIFSYDPEYIIKNTFSTGSLENINIQSYVDYFINDNFKLSTYGFDNKSLKELLYKTDKTGSRANLYNMELVAPVFDDKTGNFIKFKRFDKSTDVGINQALKNKDTVLLPTYLFAPLDRIVRKDIKLSNKFYAFMNKYFTLPYKLNVLLNPGWIVGNANDAVFKQAVSMSNKYGTSVAEEVANTISSLKYVEEINNSFDSVFDLYLKENAELIEKYPYLKIVSNIPNDKFSQKQFLDWFSSIKTKNKLTKEQDEVTKLWLFINSSQETTFKPKDLDVLEEANRVDVAKGVDDINKYNVPKNKLERILYGNKAETGIKKYGLATNNPLSDTVFNISTGWETRIRSANILNDLTHKYGKDEIRRIVSNAKELGPDGVSKLSKEYNDLNVNVMNAINAMNHANFDYNNMPNFMDKMSTVIPFPTFYLKNMAYWLDIAVNNPEIIDSVITVQDNAWRDRKKDLETDRFAAEAKGRGAVPMSSTTTGQILSKLPGPIKNKGILKPTPFNSMFGAFNSLNNPVEDFAQRANPLLTPITHHLLKDEDVKYRPYSTYPYEKNIRKGDRDFNKLKYFFHRTNPYERTINTALRTPNKISEGSAQLSDVLPSVFQPDFSKTSSTKNKKATKK